MIPDMATEVIYARVPTEVKEAAEHHANARGTTLTAAVAELLGLGLESVQDARSVSALRDRVTELELELEHARLQKERATLERQAAEQRAENLRTVASGFSSRARQAVGRCPHPSCDQEINGWDLLVEGTCPKCHRQINSMLEPQSKPKDLDWATLLPVLVAGGLVLGAVVATRSK